VFARRRLPSGLAKWLIAWTLFSAFGSLWALSSPILSVPDETAHAIYAAASARGQIWGPPDGNATSVVLPGGWANAHDVTGCYLVQPNVPAGCAEPFTAAEGEAEVTTLAGRYPPAYYMYAGLGSLVTDGANAIYAMRLLTVVLVAAFLASAVCSVLAHPRPALPLVGLGLATTPMLFFFAGAINPQAPEIAASILLWVSGAALLLRMQREPDLPLTFRNADLRRALIAAVTLPLMRPSSLIWLAVVVGTLFLAFGARPAIRRLLTATPVIAAIPLLVLTAGTNVFWLLVRGSLQEGNQSAYADTSVREALQFSTSKLDDEYREMIGVFGWLTTPAPGLVYVLFTVLLGGLLVLTALRSTTRQNLVIGLLALAVAAAPVVSEMMSYKTIPFGWQGRYTLPIAVGIPILLSLSDGARKLAGPLATRFLVSASAGLVVLHTLSFMGALNRHVFGINGFWGTTPPGWAPPLSYSALVLLATAVVTVAAFLACRAASSTEARDDEPGIRTAPPAPTAPTYEAPVSTGDRVGAATR